MCTHVCLCLCCPLGAAGGREGWLIWAEVDGCSVVHWMALAFAPLTLMCCKGRRDRRGREVGACTAAVAAAGKAGSKGWEVGAREGVAMHVEVCRIDPRDVANAARKTGILTTSGAGWGFGREGGRRGWCQHQRTAAYCVTCAWVCYRILTPPSMPLQSAALHCSLPCCQGSTVVHSLWLCALGVAACREQSGCCNAVTAAGS